MVHLVEPQRHLALDDYASVAHLTGNVRELRQEASRLLPLLKGRRLWMVNSTARGGGVAELLPPLLALLRDLGVDANWLAMDTAEPEFFSFTKRLHNLIHGQGNPHLGLAEQDLYERVSRDTAEAMTRHIQPGDILVVHDPQPLGAGAFMRERLDIAAIWRCHIGLDRDTTETRAAWAFCCHYAPGYDQAVFSAPEYIPPCFAGKATIIHPAIDPLSHKNRDLPIHKLVGILANGALIKPFGPVLTPPFPEPVQRFHDNGTWLPASQRDDIGLLFRPIITQVSRWDRLKGFLPLMQGFVHLKAQLQTKEPLDERYRQTLQLVRLILAGPDPTSIADDPEGRAVLAEICHAYCDLPPDLRDDIAILSLPMGSQKHNALLVNALQRCSDIVVQNSLQEGFGLTATEAMWKHGAVVASRAVGLRQQVRPGLDGLLIGDPENPREIAQALGGLLADPQKRETLGRSAQQRVYSDFLVFTQVRRWLTVVTETIQRCWA